MKGPDAKAGLNPRRFNISGVTVPINDAKTTTLNKAMDTTMESFCSLNNNVFAPQTINDKHNPFNNATKKTFEILFQKPSSTNPGLARL